MTHDIKPGDWVQYISDEVGFTYGGAYQVKGGGAFTLYIFDDDGDYRPVWPNDVELLHKSTDLTKIEKPFDLLDKETRERLKAWPHGVEVWRGKFLGWKYKKEPITFSSGLTYRAKPAPAEEPMQPPWDVLPKWVRFVAMDEDESVWGFEYRPKKKTEDWHNGHGRIWNISCLRFPRGNMPWEKSLVERPND